MFKFLDAYALRAQAIPAMLAVAPAIALVIALVLSTSSGMSRPRGQIVGRGFPRHGAV